MIKCNDWPIGVCSWSMQNNTTELAALTAEVGISHIHLALNPAFEPNGEAYLDEIKKQGWQLTATMIGFAQEDYSTLETIKHTGGIVPDNCWEQNKKLVLDAIKMTASLGAKYLEFHFGFIEMTNTVLADCVKYLADAAAKEGVVLLMETGQETAEMLAEFLETLAHPALAVNFDPGNMILYGKGEPIEAVEILGKWIRHVHAKDALRSPVAGQWGKEVAWGSGHVGGEVFLKALKQTGFVGALSIEREAGESRLDDIKCAARLLQGFYG
jgi:sugar phosphate isomerase/epimerase